VTQDLTPVLHYHESTKHHFNRFAASLGYLDWATQPDPFRRYSGAPLTVLPRAPLADALPLDDVLGGRAPRVTLSEESIAELLRCSMGLSAWKRFRESRWALRVNPSSGNLHPTEAYVVREGRVAHYAPREHALEERCDLGPGAWAGFAAGRAGFLVVLTSVHWREAWKYGERAFRYCQHDTGHAVAALRIAAAMLGWRLSLLPRWSSGQAAALVGTDRDDDFTNAEREEVECVAAVVPSSDAAAAADRVDASVQAWIDSDPQPLVDAARDAGWHGRANRLSAGHVPWPAIDRVAEATRFPGLAPAGWSPTPAAVLGSTPPAAERPAASARRLLLRRRSAVAFDGETSMRREAFITLLGRVGARMLPSDALYWPPQVHLAVFVHRVEGLAPGIYAYLRDRSALDDWRASMRPDFLWETVSPDLYLLLPIDVKWAANRVSCDQDIAADGFFSLGMIARFAPSLAERGAWFYRHLFWECGLIGQVLYLSAEAAGARGTGIGCFYDEAVHDVLGLSGARWQSLYHFAVGMAIDDPRLTTEPGYGWES
jgi:SagB-type dehydrogenase family enzyme